MGDQGSWCGWMERVRRVRLARDGAAEATGGQCLPREKREKSPKARGEQRASGEKPQGWRWGGAPAGADCGRWSQRPSGACAKVLQPPHSPRTGFLGLGTFQGVSVF